MVPIGTIDVHYSSFAPILSRWTTDQESMVRRRTVHEQATTPPRDRILAAARDLFYRHGIHAVGVEAVAEQAGTSKAALYRHFASKDELVAAYVRALADEGDAEWAALTAAHAGDPHQQIEAWLGRVERLMSEDGGCAIANAAVELRAEPKHPARRIIDAYKTDKREQLVRLFAEAGYCEVERLADEVFLLFEGARINLQCCLGTSAPAARLISTLRALFASHKAAGVQRPAARRPAAKPARQARSKQNV